MHFILQRLRNFKIIINKQINPQLKSSQYISEAAPIKFGVCPGAISITILCDFQLKNL